MKNLWKWLLLFVGVFLVAFVVALPFWRWSAYGFSGMPIMRSGRMGFMPRMFGGFGGFGGFRGGFMFPFMWIIPAGVIVLLVVGVVALVRAMRRPQPMQAQISPAPTMTPVPPAAPAAPVEPEMVHNCTNCGRALQPDWVNCPYCGTKV